MDKYLITFKNTHDAIKGESVVNRNKIKMKVMPTPTSITKSCGISIEFDTESYDKVRELVKSNKIEINSLFKIEDGKYNPTKF